MTWSTQQQTAVFTTAGGLRVTRTVIDHGAPFDVPGLARQLDTQRGCLFTSQSEVPGRYRRYDLGFADPPLAIVATGRTFEITALNARGDVLLEFIGARLAHPDLDVGRPAASDPRSDAGSPRLIRGTVRPAAPILDEGLRTRRASIFTLVRALCDVFASLQDQTLGLYGAFGYDLVFQMEDLHQRRARAADQRDLVLYLPDDIVVTDHAAQVSARMAYDFEFDGRSTAGLPRATPPVPYTRTDGRAFSDHAPGDYQAVVAKAKQAFARGDLFEAVPGQLFGEPCAAEPSVVFNHLARINPAPYGALINLGAGEFLVSASPEMFVRSDGRRIETCPISGTIARGADVLADAEQIKRLLNSAKDEFELNMCTDVDRNDKARICEPGSVKVIGRRQIEVYSKLIHTVDHVEGRLRPEFDALDAFLSHAWAVTVTGAPKLWAMQFVEDHERSPRRWYGAAIGGVAFDGSMNTGLTIRTIRMHDGTAEVRVGATLLFDSDPAAEEEECVVKAAALRQALRDAQVQVRKSGASKPAPPAIPANILLVDCEDSFVHTLADYARQTGAAVTVVRHDRAVAALAERGDVDLVLLSPGPGRPSDFKVGAVIDAALAADKAIFGVCLGMQALGEHFGGTLGQLPIPAHGRPAQIETRGQSKLFSGLPGRITVGRYHSLYVEPNTMPAVFAVTAATEDGIPMAIEHRDKPIAAVQFHPESIMSLEGGVGLAILRNALALAVASKT
jgi:anthranilate synthase